MLQATEYITNIGSKEVALWESLIVTTSLFCLDQGLHSLMLCAFTNCEWLTDIYLITLTYTYTQIEKYAILADPLKLVILRENLYQP